MQPLASKKLSFVFFSVSHLNYKLHKEKKSSKSADVLIDPSQVSVVGPVDLNQSVTLAVSSPSNVSLEDSFKRVISDLKDEWSTRFARIEALLTMGSNPSTTQISASGHIAPVFSPVKVKVNHPPPVGALSSSPFLPHTVSSPPPPAGSAPGPGQEQVLDSGAVVDNLQPDHQQPETSGSLPVSSASQPLHQTFASPLENLYLDRSQDTEPAFGPPDREPVCYDDLQDEHASGSEADPQEKDRIISEDQSYRETGEFGLTWNGPSFWTGNIWPNPVMIIRGPVPEVNRWEKSQLHSPLRTGFAGSSNK